MTRQTSIDTYIKVQESGLLSRRRFQVYDVLFHNGPLSQTETHAHIKDAATLHSVGPRFAELKKMGVIIEVGTRRCSITGENVYVWDVTDKLPVKFERKIARKAMKSQLLQKIAGVGGVIDEKWKVPLREIYLMAKEI